MDLLPENYQSKSGTICAPLIFEIFKLSFCKQIFLWFSIFCPTQWIGDQAVAERAASIWKHFTKVIHYWERLCKSLRPAKKSYRTLIKHYRDPLVLMKLQFFAFIAGILKPYLTTFQTNRPMVPFMCDELMETLHQLLRLIFSKMLRKKLIQLWRNSKRKADWWKPSFRRWFGRSWHCSKESVGKNPKYYWREKENLKVNVRRWY